MKNLRALSKTLVVALLLSSCAHSYPEFQIDRSPNLDLSPIAKRFGVPSCKVSVPLTQEEALRAAKLDGDPHPEERPDWATLKKTYKPGDQLRQVICITSGKNGLAAGDIFYGLFREGQMIAEMHNMIIN